MNSSIPTPLLANSTDERWSQVYEPAEDTFLLLDALEKDYQFIFLKKPCVCLEVGSGSGMIISALAGKFRNEIFCLSTDINPSACEITQVTAKMNNAPVDIVCGHLMSPFRNGLIDLVVFNPPYVVTPSEEVTSGEAIVRSWAGGLNGREVIDSFIKLIVPALSSKGFGYLLLLKENKPEEVVKMIEDLGCTCTSILTRQLRGELLIVIRFEKTS